MASQQATYLAFDVGARRIGVARAIVPPHIAQPLATLQQADGLAEDITRLVQAEQPAVLIVGLPRNQSGDETAQTEVVRGWVASYLQPLKLPIVWQDESLTSVLAEERLEASGHPYVKSDVDAMAASIILQDYLEGLAV